MNTPDLELQTTTMRVAHSLFFALLLMSRSMESVRCLDHRSSYAKGKNYMAAEDYPVNNNVTRQCLSCVTSGTNLFDFNGGNVCITNTNTACPEYHRCCHSVECCVTDGCRSPTDTFYMETAASEYSQKCNICQDGEITFSNSGNQTYIFGNVSYVINPSVNSGRNVCQYRRDYQGTGWYDTVTQTECATTYQYPPQLPKCATCTDQLQNSFQTLLQQLPNGVQCDIYTCSSYGSVDDQNCDEPIKTCECFCHFTYLSRMACPQLMNYAQKYFNDYFSTVLNSTAREGNATLKNVSTTEQTPSIDGVFNNSTAHESNVSLSNNTAQEQTQLEGDGNLNNTTADVGNVSLNNESTIEQTPSQGQTDFNKLTNQPSSSGSSRKCQLALIAVYTLASFLLS